MSTIFFFFCYCLYFSLLFSRMRERWETISALSLNYIRSYWWLLLFPFYFFFHNCFCFSLFQPWRRRWETKVHTQNGQKKVRKKQPSLTWRKKLHFVFFIFNWFPFILLSDAFKFSCLYSPSTFSLFFYRNENWLAHLDTNGHREQRTRSKRWIFLLISNPQNKQTNEMMKFLRILLADYCLVKIHTYKQTHDDGELHTHTHKKREVLRERERL